MVNTSSVDLNQYVYNWIPLTIIVVWEILSDNTINVRRATGTWGAEFLTLWHIVDLYCVR